MIVAVADCTGHGIPGAMVSMIGNQLFNVCIHVLEMSNPKEILTEVNQSIRKTLRQGQSRNRDGMDVALSVTDKQNKTLQYARAKSPLVYIQNNELHQIRGNRFPVGGYSGAQKVLYQKHQINISEPTCIYMYSDGFQDQFGGEQGRKNFQRLLHLVHSKSMKEQLQELELELAEWRGKTKQIDDILVLGVKIDWSEQKN